MAKTIYIGGKVTGLPFQEVKHRFAIKESELSAQGHYVINPIRIVTERDMVDCKWEHIMKALIRELVSADELHLMPCWRDSKGALMERDIATRLGIHVVYCPAV